MSVRLFLLLIAAIIFLPTTGYCQAIEKIVFDTKDSSTYYLAIRPQSKEMKGVLVLLTSFAPPESLLPDTKLHNVAYANDILTIVAFMNQKLYADSPAIRKLNNLFKDVVTRFNADTAKFVLAGYDEAGNIALRYTELTYEFPTQFLVQPKAVFGIDTPVDLFALWHWSERQIKKNFWPGAVGDARYYMEIMTRENGTIYHHPENYNQLTPFNKDGQITGNEKFLNNVAVRLYYDTDINWHLRNRRNSLYDTKIPDGSELINRLLLSGNKEAELVAAKPGVRSNGVRHPNTISIVDEVECIQWIRSCLNIFDVHTWVPPYYLSIPEGWTVERFSLPPDFASQITFQGVEDVRFAPGWGDSTKEDYWSYAYVWWVTGNSNINAETLKENLKAYYTGLVDRNVISRKIPVRKVKPVMVTVKKITSATGDIEIYNGRIDMLDYMMQKPIILNTIISVRSCGLQKHTAIFVQVSPKLFTHSVWQQFSKMDIGFQCE